MTIANSYGLWTDASCTVAFTGLYQLVHKTDLSDNPQDFVLYLGSTTASRILKATSNPGVDQITLTPTKTITARANSTAYTLGQIVEPATPNTYMYECTTAGTSGGSIPTWPTGIGSTVVDGTVTWTNIGKFHPTTEVKLALTSGGLAGATGGAALNLGTSISSLAANKVEINIRITNTVTTVQDNTGYPNIKLYLNGVTEYGV